MPRINRLLSNVSLLTTATLLFALPAARAQTNAATLTPYTPAQIEGMLDPQMKVVIDLYKTIMGTPITALTPPDARQQFSAEDAAKIVARTTGAAEAPMPVGKVTDGVQIPGYEGIRYQSASTHQPEQVRFP